MSSHVNRSSLFADQVFAVQPPALRQVTQRIAKIGGINLGQGVCQLPVPTEVLQAAARALSDGHNRYTAPAGLISLRTAIAGKLARHNNIEADPATQILITCGTTGAFEGICAALLNPGDTVVSFSPYYPYHDNALKRYQANVRYVPLIGPNWEIDWEKFDQAIDQTVRFILINTPGNPTGKVFTEAELTRIGESCQKHDLLAVTDEIYEYMTYDGRTHISPASLPSLKDRTITMGGYSKTFAITGWRIGFLVARAEIAEKLVGLLDNIYVCAPAPLQQGVADAIDSLGDSFYAELNAMYARKRHLFADALTAAGLKPMLPKGAYYMMADYRTVAPNLDSSAFVDLMIETTKVGAVPANDFVVDPANHRFIRFCYALPDEELQKAGQQLAQLKGAVQAHA